jgi:hypothetical protein
MRFRNYLPMYTSASAVVLYCQISGVHFCIYLSVLPCILHVYSFLFSLFITAKEYLSKKEDMKLLPFNYYLFSLVSPYSSQYLVKKLQNAFLLYG